MMPTWSHTSSSSRRLWLDTSTVVPRSATSPIIRLHTCRRIITLKREHQKTFVGFIADQSPKWNSIHHWVPFLHRETPIFIGTEQIAKQVGAVVYFTDVKRIKRGYYHCELKRMTVHPQELPDYQLTDMYARMLEEMIQREPAYWLWSHNRWKRTKEEWERRQSQV